MRDSRSRRVAAVEVPPRRGGMVRGAAFVGATAIAVLALIIALNTVRGPQPAAPLPSPSGAATASGSVAPTASVTGAVSVSPTPTASPAAVGAPDRSHGFLTRRPSALRSEADARSLVSLPESYTAAVSIDGKRVAMLRTSETGGQLVTFDTNRPQDMTTIVDFAGSGEGAGQIAWAADNSASVLISVHKFRVGGGEATEYTTLRAVDLATKNVTEIARFTDGRFLVPLYWDPVTRSAGAYETGPGGFGVDYVSVRGTQATRTNFPFETIASSINADARTGRVLAIVGRDGTAVSTWRYDRFEQRTDLRPAAGEQVHAALWRPNIEEVVVSVGPPVATSEPPMRMEAWSMANAHRQLSGAGTSRLLLVRVDGTAALNLDFTLVDLETGRALGVVPRFLAACAIPPGGVPCGSELPYLPVMF
jgi:hypothetical protein